MKEISRKDKRRYNLENKVNKIQSSFLKDKDIYYKDRLTSLQTDLTSLHQGSNLLYQRKLRDLQEDRDFELVKLRLYEEYRVSRSSIEFQEDIDKAKESHEKLVKLCKEKLYSKIETQIKKLKEEKMLMDVANIHSYSMDYSRPFYQKNTRSHTNNNNNSNATANTLNDINGTGSPNYFKPGATLGTGSGWESNNDSATDTTMGLDRRSLRRRGKTRETGGTTSGFTTNNDYYSGSNTHYTDDSDSKTGYSTAQRTSGRGKSRSNTTAITAAEKKINDLNSESDFLQGISDYADLQVLLFGEKEEKMDNKKKHRNNPRYSAKSAPPLNSLTQDEVTDDIALLKTLSGEPQTPFKPHSTA